MGFSFSPWNSLSHKLLVVCLFGYVSDSTCIGLLIVVADKPPSVVRRPVFVFGLSISVFFCMPLARGRGPQPLLGFRGCHLGGLAPPFWHPGDHFGTSGTPRGHFSASGPPWRTMGAAGWTRGGAEQDVHRFWSDLGTFFWRLFGHRSLKFQFVSGLLPEHFVIDFWLENWTLGALNSRFSLIRHCRKQFLQSKFHRWWARIALFVGRPGNRLGEIWIFNRSRI